MESVPYFRPEIGEEEIAAVVETLRSKWLTTGPRTAEFEARFGEYIGAPHAVALNSCTAALHLALVALGLRRGQGVLVPTLTFAATAEVVRYIDATPVFVDVDPVTLCMDPAAAQAALTERVRFDDPIVGGIPVHYAGQMAPMPALAALLRSVDGFVVEDAAHALPAAVRDPVTGAWCGVGALADVACFSFYANKTITTGEGGMATTADETIAATIRQMSLHGMSRDGWNRFRAGGSWDYEIVAAGFKYNLTDVAAAIGLQQLRRADTFCAKRTAVAAGYAAALADLDEIELPTALPDRQHSWHLYPLRLRLDRLAMGRDEFINELNRRGVGTSVHWRPLHMQPYYVERYGYRPEDFPVACREWQRLISLPIFPGMTDAELAHVVATVRSVTQSARHRPVAVA